MAVFYNRAVFKDIQIGLLQHGVVELTLLGYEVCLLQRVDNSLLFITINIVVVGHNPIVEFLEGGDIFGQCVLSTYRKYAMVVQRVLADTVLSLWLKLKAWAELDFCLYILANKSALIEQ